MTVDANEATTTGNGPEGSAHGQHGQLSLGTAAARNLATTTKTQSQMQGITSRWLLRVLPWVQVSGGAYRVNRRRRPRHRPDAERGARPARLRRRGAPEQPRRPLHPAGVRRGRRDHDSRAAGHEGETELPGTFADYELSPREYELSVAQTVLRVHSRVADLYNKPMNQTEQQLRLTIEALRERQEHELVNNRGFGLLHNADFDQRIQTHSGPPTPDDMDELLSRRRDARVLLARPRAIAAFGRECSKRGVYPESANLSGSAVPAWRGVPLLPCNKIPVVDGHTTSILAMRTGEDDQGVVGLHQTGIPDEYQPGLSVRFMGINEKAVISYLVSAYHSAAVLVPDALGVLENVEIARPRG
jgi:hypothetical protein